MKSQIIGRQNIERQWKVKHLDSKTNANTSASQKDAPYSTTPPSQKDAPYSTTPADYDVPLMSFCIESAAASSGLREFDLSTKSATAQPGASIAVPGTSSKYPSVPYLLISAYLEYE